MNATLKLHTEAGQLSESAQKTKRMLFVIPYIGLVERIGIMQLSAICKQMGHKVELATVSRGDINEKMQAFSPDFVCYAIHSGEHTSILRLNKKLKEQYPFTSVFGGPHAMFHPQQVITEDGVDVVCMGEAEEVFIDLMNGKPLQDIQGIYYRDEAGVHFTGQRPLERDLDKYPFPDRELLYEYEKELGEHGEKRISMSRGCPFICTYCWNNEMNKRGIQWGKVRVRSVDKVIQEIQEIRQKYPIKHIRFTEDTLNAIPIEWIEEFAEKYGQLKIPFTCNVRASLTTPRLVELLKQAGCMTVFMAIETSNEQIRSELLKRYETNDEIRNAVTWFHEAGIKVATYSLCALPIENPLEVDLETLKFNAELKVDMSWASIFSPTPSTDLANYSIDHGYFSGDYDELYVNTKTESILRINNAREVANLQKFFGICSNHPWLIPIVRQLIKLPPNRFYRYFQYAYYGWREKFILSDSKPSVREVFKLAKLLRHHI